MTMQMAPIEPRLERAPFKLTAERSETSRELVSARGSAPCSLRAAPLRAGPLLSKERIRPRWRLPHPLSAPRTPSLSRSRSPRLTSREAHARARPFPPLLLFSSSLLLFSSREQRAGVSHLPPSLSSKEVSERGCWGGLDLGTSAPRREEGRRRCVRASRSRSSLTARLSTDARGTPPSWLSSGLREAPARLTRCHWQVNAEDGGRRRRLLQSTASLLLAPPTRPL